MKGSKPNPLGNVVPMKGTVKKSVPDAPEFMSTEARRIWDELAPDLVAKDRLDPSYAYQFASYCESVSNFIYATSVIAVDGFWFTAKTRNGLQQKKTAAWGAQQEAMNAMRRDSALFGMTPVDAARLKSGGQGDLFKDIMDQLKNGSA